MDGEINSILNLQFNKLMKILIILSAVLWLATACALDEPESDAYGNFEATEVKVSSEQPGKLISFDVEEGKNLESDQLVGRVDTLRFAIKLHQIEAQRRAVLSRVDEVESEIDVIREKKAVAENERDRIQRMHEDDAATSRELDQAEGEVRVLERQMESARSRLGSIHSEAESIEAQKDEVRDQLRRTGIENPVEGTVLSKYAEPGEMAQAGQPLYRIADLSTMYLRVFVSGRQLPQIELNQPVTVLIDNEDGRLDEFDGEISWISSRAEFTPSTVQTREERLSQVYAVKVRVENDGRLKIGMPGEVRF